jgi:hypothetical protein
MNAWQRFKAFPKAARIWCWILAAASIYLIANTIYLNAESPYYYISPGGATINGLNASQMNNFCHSAAGQTLQIASASSATTCNNAQSVEQQKAVSAWVMVLVLIALVTLFVVFWRKTFSASRVSSAPDAYPSRPAGAAAGAQGQNSSSAAGWTPPPGWTPAQTTGSTADSAGVASQSAPDTSAPDSR